MRVDKVGIFPQINKQCKVTHIKISYIIEDIEEVEDQIIDPMTQQVCRVDKRLVCNKSVDSSAGYNVNPPTALNELNLNNIGQEVITEQKLKEEAELKFNE